MSTSLKVVSMAAVFCASLRRRAMVWRSRVMRTRSSRAASSGGDGARACSGGGGGGSRRRAADAARSIAASTSPLVTRPSLPRAGERAADRRRFSVDDLAHRRRRAASSAPRGLARRRGLRLCRGRGAALRAASIGAVVCGFGSRLGRGGRGAARAFLDRAEQRADRDGLAALAAIVARARRPAGAGTSTVTLSVSSSTSGSSALTASPSFLNHLPIVASVTDSPSVGTRISFAIASSALP